jgi:MoxR-like ATPase
MTPLPAPYDQFIAAADQPTHLPAEDRFSEAWHRWSEAEMRAVVQAWASERPLLVRGEAGSGKSQLARALAAVLGVPLEMEVIHPRFEATDLKYREDPVRRLARAQVLGATRPSAETADSRAWLDQELNPAHFISKGAIWRAMTAPEPVATPPAGSAASSRTQTAAGSPPCHPHWPRAVLLIDEVDKADTDVPHALLDVLGNRSFQVPASGQWVRCVGHWPLIVVTTNEDRELPAPFVRRCAVLNLKPPSHELAGGQAFVNWLIERARAHVALQALDGDEPHEEDNPLRVAAKQTLADRRDAANAGLPTVGLAEYLDLLYSVRRLAGGSIERARDLLGELSPFALVKQREQDQQRPAVGPAGG